MTWNIGNIIHDTPFIIRRLRSAINYVAGTSLFSCHFLATKLNVSTEEVAEILGGIIVGCNFLLTMFGEEITDQSK